MTAKRASLLGAWTLAFCLFSACGRSSMDGGRGQDRLVRIAELEIDPNQIENYKDALKEEIETSIRLEPGVLTLYAVSVKDHPSQIRIFEVYADMQAYRSHLETPHFKKYKAGTQDMVKALRLVETEPILLGARSR